MDRLIDLIKEIPVKQWDYYNGIDAGNTILNPFSSKRFTHTTFIERYFKRGERLKSKIDRNQG